MPRRDVVLTGIIAFAAGCAVGANWPKIRKKIGPMIGKAGFQISELGEFLSESFPESEVFFKAAANGRADAHRDMEHNGRNGHVETDNGTSSRTSTQNGAHRNGVSRPTASGNGTVRSKSPARRKKAAKAKV